MAKISTEYFYSLEPIDAQGGLPPKIPLGKTLTRIGRHSTNDLPVPLESVSRFHSHLETRDGRMFVVDLGSSNGTFVNRERVKEKALANGDEVSFGTVAFTFHQTKASFHPERTPSDDSRVRLIGEDDSRYAHTLVQKLPQTETTESFNFKQEVTDATSLRRARRLLGILYDFHKKLGNRTEEEELYEIVLDLIFEALPCDNGVILSRENHEEDFHPVQTRARGESKGEIAISRTIVERCIEEQAAILSRNAMVDERFNQSQSIVMNAIQSAMCAPFLGENRVRAICFLESKGMNRPFDEEDLEFFSAISTEVSILLEHAKMRREMAIREKMAVIGETITGMAHNVKNVLLLSQGGIELMDMCLERKKFDTAGESWVLIKRGLTRINTMVKDMLEFSRQREIVKKRSSVNRIIRETRDLVSEELEKKRIELVLNLDDSIYDTMLDEEGFYKAIMNLIVNASEAVQEGQGRITVTSQLTPEGTVNVTVEDNGTGITAENMRKIFAPFFSTKGSKGTGLGLPMTRKIIEDMNGKLLVRSEVGQGTTFEIVLQPDDSADETDFPATQVSHEDSKREQTQGV